MDKLITMDNTDILEKIKCLSTDAMTLANIANVINIHQYPTSHSQYPRRIHVSFDIDKLTFININTKNYVKTIVDKIKSETKDFAKNLKGTIDCDCDLRKVYDYFTYAIETLLPYGENLINKNRITCDNIYYVLLNYAYECRALIGRLI